MQNEVGARNAAKRTAQFLSTLLVVFFPIALVHCDHDCMLVPGGGVIELQKTELIESACTHHMTRQKCSRIMLSI